MKKLIALLLALVMVFGLVACGASEPAPEAPKAEEPKADAPVADAPAANEDVTLRLWTFLDTTSTTNGRAIVLRKLIENFEASHPGVDIVVETQEWTTLASKFFAAHETGEAPDICMINTIMLGEALNRGVFEPMENLFLNEMSAEDKADLASDLFSQSFDGTYNYTLQLFYGVFGVYYRKDLFAEKNINVADIKTWEDLAEVAQKLTYTDADGKKVWGWGTGYSLEVSDAIGILPAALFGQEGGMYDAEGKPNNWTGEQAQKALQMEIDMITKYGVSPESSASITSEDVYVDFAAGNYAMIGGAGVRMPTVQGQTAFDPENVGFMPAPGIDENTTGGSFSAGWNLGVWSGSKHKDIAGEFLEYCCSVEADELWVTEAQQIPLRKSTLEKCADFLAKPTNEWLAVAKEILDNYAYIQDTSFSTTGINEDLQNAFLLAYVEGYTVEEALAEVAQNFIDRNSR